MAAMAWTAISAGVAAAGDTPEFKLLSVEGQIVRWSSKASRPTVLTYAFADREITGGHFGTCAGLGSPQTLLDQSALSRANLLNAAARAFAQWQKHVNVVFRPAKETETPMIVIGASLERRGIAFTDLILAARSSTPTATREIRGSMICLNPDKPWKIGFDGNVERYDLEHVLAHEIGHVLGLDHPSALGHVMSFRYTEGNRELTTGDRLGAIQLYGARRGTND